MDIKSRKKLIEVALPLDAINKASARGKIHPPRTSQHLAPVVDAATTGLGAGGNLHPEGRRPLGP